MMPFFICQVLSQLLFSFHFAVLKSKVINNQHLGFAVQKQYTSNKNIHSEMILDVGIGEKRKETRFLI